MRLSSSATVLLATLLSSMAHAKVVYKSGNWALDDRSADALPQNLCAMVQTAKIGRTTWRLEITHAKNTPGVTEVLLHQTGTGPLSWSLTTATGETLVFASAGKVGTAELLWHVPQKTSALVAHWDGKKDIQMKPADGSRGGFKLFDSGFAQVKAEMLKRCLGALPLVDAGFEAAFLKKTSPIDPTLIAADTVTKLRALLSEGHQVYLQGAANSAELAQLRAQFAVPLQEAAALTTTITQLEQTTIPNLLTAQRTNETLETTAKADLQRLSALIPGQERALTAATQARDRAYEAIAPYLAEHAALSDAVDSAQAQISSGEARIGEIDRASSSAESQLRALNSELSNLTSVLRRNESELRSAEAEARRAESEFRSFRPDAELRERLQRDSSYQSAVRDLSRTEREADRARDQWKTAVADRDNKERIVTACRAQGPEADCRSQQDDWKRAVALAERLESEHRRFDGQISSYRSAIDRAESSAARDVERERNILGDRMSQTQRRADEFSRAVREGQQREREITSFELPRLNDQLRSLDRERPLVVDQVARARSEASRANSALVSFEARVGWVAKLRAYETADAAMDARQSELNVTLRGKQAAERSIQQAQTQRPLLAQQVAERRQALATAQARLLVVRQSLVAFEEQRGVLEATGGELASQLAGLATQFADQLP